MTRSTVLAAALAALAAAPAAQTLTAPVTVPDVAVYSPGMGRDEGPFTFVSLRTGAVVPAADSASASWDVAFRGTTLLVNGGTSGPGKGEAAVVDVAYDALDALPAVTALVADGANTCPRGVTLAVCTGSGNGWYLYGGNGVAPIPTRSVVLRLADGTLAKLRVTAYRLAEAEVDGARPRYVSVEAAPLADPFGARPAADGAHAGH